MGLLDSISLPFPTSLFDGVETFLQQFLGRDDLISSGVESRGPAADYALTWEWGNVRQTEAGPRTVLGRNPNGEEVFLSIQAPFGYIRVNTPLFWEAIRTELQAVRFDQSDAGALTLELEKASARISERIRRILHDTAPVDTGQLQSSFVVVQLGRVQGFDDGSFDVAESLTLE